MQVQAESLRRSPRGVGLHVRLAAKGLALLALAYFSRVRFVSALFRSAVGEYLVLGIIMCLLLGIGTFALFVSESRARQVREQERLVAV